MVDDRIAAMIVPVHHDEITNSRIIGHSYHMIAKLARYFRPFFSLTCYQLVESFFLGCEKIMLCEEPPANGCNFAVGEVIHIAYLGDLSVYHVRLKSGQMISAQLQNAHRHRKGLPTWGDEVRLCWEVDSCVVLTV